MSATRPLRSLHALGPARRRLLVQATVLLGATVAALRVMPFRQARPAIGRLGGALRIRPASLRDVRWAVLAASRRVPGSRSCLPRAMAAFVLLDHMGWSPALHIGVSKHGEAFGAHAWTEVEGQIVVGGEESAAFTPLHSFRER